MSQILFAAGRAPLDGIAAVALQVEEPSYQTRVLGFTRESIEWQVTGALRRLGIGVVDSRPEIIYTTARHELPPPVVRVKVNAIRKPGGYVGGVKIWVAEQAELYRIPGKYRLLNTYHYSAGWSDASASGMRDGLYLQLRRGYKHLVKTAKPKRVRYSPKKVPSSPMFTSMNQ